MRNLKALRLTSWTGNEDEKKEEKVPHFQWYEMRKSQHFYRTFHTIMWEKSCKIQLIETLLTFDFWCKRNFNILQINLYLKNRIWNIAFLNINFMYAGCKRFKISVMIYSFQCNWCLNTVVVSILSIRFNSFVTSNIIIYYVFHWIQMKTFVNS